MKNLIIDAGNTRVKIVVFEEGTLVSLEICVDENLETTLKNILKKNKISKTIVSSVGAFTKKILFVLQDVKNVVLLSNETPVPFVNLYKTPKTLGVDRIALVSAAAVQFPQKNVLIIDAGTCITLDFINNKNEYLGGAISPGLQMRYKALHSFTEKLPQLTINEPEQVIGNDTNSSIHSGIVYGFINEINGAIAYYESKYKDLTIVLTGGDAHYLSKRLKNGIFANPNFLQEGLNSILIYNT